MQIPDNLILVLAGGNALGAYQAGAYQAIEEHGVEPAWIAGASIGAVNGALIAGNPKPERVWRLREFWRLAEQFGKPDPASEPDPNGTRVDKQLAVMQTLVTGRPGLFAPRFGAFWSVVAGLPKQASLFDTEPTSRTLRRLVDFDRLAGGRPRLSVTAVDVETGEDVVFDTAAARLEAEHIRASAAFPVIYPPVEIGGRALVDPGVSANSPLRAVFSEPPRKQTLCLAIDLFSLRGARPRSLDDALRRGQDLLFGNQANHAIKALQKEYGLRQQVQELQTGAKRGRPARAQKTGREAAAPVTLIHISYSGEGRETAGKMFDYSETSIRERWAAGRRDVARVLELIEALPEPDGSSLFSAYQLEDGALADFDPADRR